MMKDQKNTFIDDIMQLDPSDPEFNKKMNIIRVKHRAKNATKFKNIDYAKGYQSQKQADKENKLQKFAEEMNVSKDKINVKPNYGRIVADARQLTDQLKDLNPINAGVPKITEDLDHDLYSLAKTHQKQYYPLIAAGQKRLNKFDKNAATFGFKLPKRQIDKLWNFSNKHGERDLSVQEIKLPLFPEQETATQSPKNNGLEL